ncbi:MAG: CesT family type III secretion system chaperone [Candidatus Palauibacterales bacterium]|nr:CesT family type III secretion system chaperone [Candidatus Palauibacterales bacterium]MDP2528794.1 CesT family type III secretion system chaperone [Candidatus Palauibacterales bacterium]
MISREDIESYLIRTDLDYEEIGEGMWLVRPEGEAETGGPAIVASYLPPVLLLRTVIREVPEGDSAQLRIYRRLLELNASDLVHGAYGLEDGEIVLADTLELENLDFTEFRASLESLALAVTSHLKELSTD